ncbi:CBO0543 family protein [Bacillus sp. 31A1R]|uniref:CBO0543 family protein n=1 Tax=Robertmurraya mangrovi TaxID=3098077 RepID=A0ABU5IWP8_9BACI|nr:CBO0543 family protein [Bacillus sp. 31A1R]MDZ5471561.1 CBO0543 family protein [Bacillus sp. 31A1R]
MLIIFVPKKRIRESIAVFLFFHFLTWLFSIGLTYFGLLEAPFREFPYATKINFSMEYMVFPTIAVFFQLLFPKRKIYRIIHYILTVTFILFIMGVIGYFTEIMDVTKESLTRSALNFTVELWLCRKYITWLMDSEYTKKNKVESI